MSNARTLANTINANSEIVVPSGGVNFGTSTDGSGTVTGGVMDDYEIGSWSPSLGGTATYVVPAMATYIKIGQMVLLRATILVDEIGTGSQTAVTGIPFNCLISTNFGGSMYYIDSIATNVVHISPFIDSNQANIRFRTLTSSGASFGTANVFQNGTRADFTIAYQTA